MSQIFTAVTIGPIYDTMQLTSRPAGLWGASSLFSWIAAELLISLHEQDCVIISPWVDWTEGRLTLPMECEEIRRKGVGLLHDRIFLKGDMREQVKTAISSVENKLADKLDSTEETKRWIHHYLRIYAMVRAIPDHKNPIAEMSQYLDAMELEPNYVAVERENPLLKLFEGVDASGGKAKGASDKLKDSFLVPDKNAWMLWGRDKSIRDLYDIARSDIGETQITRKYQRYYAVLKMDGDNMGSVINCLSADEISSFSKRCLCFCTKASELVLHYDGMPIYAGGDDLLAIVPVIGYEEQDGKELQILKLIEQIRNCFNEEFAVERQRESVKQNGKPPTVSFGISIQYYRSPLYEALERADHMLGEAKHTPKKNALYLDLQKHSGQSAKIAVHSMDSSEMLEILNDMIEKVMQKPIQEKEASEELCLFLSGAGYQLEAFQPLFYEVILERNRDMLGNLMKNLFDNAAQKKYGSYLKLIRELLWNTIQETTVPDDLSTQEKKDAYCKCIMEQVQSMLRLVHFLLEKKGERE